MSGVSLAEGTLVYHTLPTTYVIGNKNYTIILNDMICYDICLLQMGFHPVAVVGKLVQKQERDSYIQTEIQYTKQYTNKEYTQ
jgi:hypothetical protein